MGPSGVSGVAYYLSTTSEHIYIAGGEERGRGDIYMCVKRGEG